jgi:class 3 adenylate cyclase
MLRAPLAHAYARLGPRYVRLALALEYAVSFVVVAGGVLLLDLYVDISTATLLRILLVAEVLVAFEVAAALWVSFRLIRPADPWLHGERTPRQAVAAWGALAGLPVELMRFGRGLPAVLNTIPISIYVTLQLDGSIGSFLAIAAGAAVVLAYALFLRFFAIELTMRPVLADISADLPDGADLGRRSIPLRGKLLGALPIINVITGVVVVGLASDDPNLRALGVGVLVALGVAFTISFELSALLARSLLEPIEDLREGTERVTAGDLRVRVPVLGTDETGRLAESFNQMVAGLEERERLREAFGAFVDPQLADRVLQEGTVLEAEEADVSVLFVDIRDFTAFAERAGAAEVVTELNAFYERVVPVLVRHGGHANKFVGDGLLAVFGAPEHLPDHADRCVAAALEIAAVVEDAYGGRLRIGIGVNSGPVVAGTIGGGGRVEFTVIGDTVNTAARIEALTRETDDTILITEATFSRLRRGHGGFAERGTAPLRGRQEPVKAYAALAGSYGLTRPARMTGSRAAGSSKASSGWSR